MEIKLDKVYPMAATAARAWAVLSDVRATAACMPGAEITDQIDDSHYKGLVKCKVGPAVMTFNGDIEVLGLDQEKRQLQMLGKGADRGGSSASMNLTAQVAPGETPQSSMLVGQAVIVVNGKLAQFGSRLLAPVSDTMLARFAENFRAAVEAPSADAAAPSATTSMETGMVGAGEGARARAPAAELNAFGLLWATFKRWLAGLFGP